MPCGPVRCIHHDGAHMVTFGDVILNSRGHHRLHICMGPWKPYTRGITFWFLVIMMWDATYTGFLMPLGTAFIDKTAGTWEWLNILDSMAGTLPTFSI